MAQGSAIVFGGGLIGCASAYYLCRHGWDVTIIERDRIGSGASHGNCGYICPSHALPLSGPGVIRRTLPTLLRADAALSIPWRYDPGLWRWLWNFRRECTRGRMLRTAVARNALLASSMSLYRSLLAEEQIKCEWSDRGLLLVFKSRYDFDRYAETAELLDRDFSIESICYPGDEVKQLEPALKPDMAGGWHFPHDAHVRPDLLLTGLQNTLERQGATIQQGVELREIQIEAGRAVAVDTSAESMSADLFVLATGAEAARFAGAIGCRIPIQPGKGYSITMAPLRSQPQIPMIFEQHHVGVTPLESAFRVGSTMEFTGFDRSLNRKRLALLRNSAAEHLEAPLPDAVEEEWSGWRPMVYDGLPCIGRAPAAENLIVAAGNGMIGLASAPATGKIVAEIASEVGPHLDPSPYSLRRF